MHPECLAVVKRQGSNMQIPSCQNTRQWSCSLKIYISGVNTTCVNCVKAAVNLTEFVHSLTLVIGLFASFAHIMTVYIIIIHSIF